MKVSFYSLTYEDLKAHFFEKGFSNVSSSQLFNWSYKKRKKTLEGLKLSKALKAHISEKFDFTLPKMSNVKISSDKTVKFLFELSDGEKVETVLIPFHNKYSLCLSSQVGCAMKCSFCFTGTQGFKRNLKTHEIIGQVLKAYEWLDLNRPQESKIRNIVFMGQGEPLHNFTSVKKACEILVSQYGLSIGFQKITVSTAGYLPGLKKWMEESMPGVNLALSLHSPYKEKRDKLIPINRAYPLEEVLKLIEGLPLSKKQFVTYEYLLIKEFNDSTQDARALGNLLKGKRAYINLIPFNPFPGSSYQRPTDSAVEAFKKALDEYQIPTLIRKTKGDEVLAACGQLNTLKEKSI